MNIRIVSSNNRATVYSSRYLQTEARRLAKESGHKLGKWSLEVHESNHVTRLLAHFSDSNDFASVVL